MFVAAPKQKLIFRATASPMNHFYSHITINMLYLWVHLNGAVMESYFLSDRYHLKSDPNRVIKNVAQKSDVFQDSYYLSITQTDIWWTPEKDRMSQMRNMLLNSRERC